MDTPNFEAAEDILDKGWVPVGQRTKMAASTVAYHLDGVMTWGDILFGDMSEILFAPPQARIELVGFERDLIANTPVASIRIALGDGRSVIAQMNLASLCEAVDALRAHYLPSGK